MTQALLTTAARRVLGAALGLGLAWQTLAAPALAQTAPQAAPAAAGRPAMWVVRDADSTIYLFGTMHLLRPQTLWRTPEVTQALRSSEEVWFEIALPEDQQKFAAELQPLLIQHGLDRSRPLSSRLNEADRAKLAGIMKELGGDPAMLEPMRPWFAGFTLAQLMMAKTGYDPAKGAEMVLVGDAKAQGKKVLALETMVDQIRALSGSPPEVELATFRQTLDQFDEGPAMLSQMETRWAAGDLEGLWTLVGEEYKREYPQAYELLLTKRNEAWADQIAKELRESGTDFMAVGALHLIGPDSVQALLAQRGIRAIPVSGR